MKYLPLEHLVFKSKLTEEQIERNLSKFIIDKYPLKFLLVRTSDHTNYYVGKLRKLGFKITVRCATNSFAPVITGHYLTNGLETVVKVTFRLHHAMLAFLVLWAGPLLTVFVIMSIEAIIHKQSGAVILFPLGIVVLLYFVVNKGFKSASKEAIKYLEKAFETQAIQN